MVGGTIQDVYMFEDRLSLLVRGTGCESSDLRCIDVTLDAAREGVCRGDTIWWQAGIALWTPHQGPPREDVHLERIGFSYDPKYLWPRVAALCRQGICPECGKTDCMADGEGLLWCGRCGASLNMSEVVIP